MSRDRMSDDAVTDTGAAGSRRPRPRRPRRKRNTTALLPQMLAASVEIDPSKDAVVCGERRISYAELDSRSSKIARTLIDRGIGPEDIVALGITRSLESVLALWSIAKTGAAFVPVDPTYPVDRVQHMLSDSGARVGLTTAAFRDRLPDGCDWSVLDDEAFVAALNDVSDEKVSVTDRVAPLSTDNAAYVIYTSGSTGLPKGVVVTHSGLASLAGEQRDRYSLTATARTLHFASPSFDASILELLMAIASGATMVVAPTGIYGGDELANLLRAEKVTHAFITPAALASVDPEGLGDLRVIVVGGESCPPELVDSWGVGRSFFNAYGPTESTVASNISAPLSPGDRISIGDAIAGTTAHVLDRRLRPVPSGVAGELYLSGSGVARGYRGKPGLTADRFVADPFAEGGARMYRTGDVVRRNSSGALEFVARNDFQVKVRGFRIELGEVDTALSAHPSVTFAVTIGHTGATGETVLVSYVRLEAGSAADVEGLASFVGKTLPKHMIPSSIMFIDDIPLTPAGKLDRGGLPEPVFVAREYRAPETDAETTVAGVFTEILGVERVGKDDDFFELGGNSLSATRLAARIGAALDVNFSAREVFEDSTVAGLAAAADRLDDGNYLPLTAQERPDRIPLSYAQQRMWFLNRFDNSSLAYNVPLAIRLTGTLDAAAMEQAVRDVVERHEVLRTVYPEHDGTGSQLVLAAKDASVRLGRERVDEAAVTARVTDFLARGFDVTAEVPVRTALFEVDVRNDNGREHTDGATAILVLVAHHIALDGYSLGPLMRDIMTAYTARSAGLDDGLTELDVQYADFTLWQRAVLGDEDDPDSVMARQVSYWKSRLDGVPELLELPTDRPRPSTPSGAGGAYTFVVDGPTSNALDELARDRGATPFVVMEAALAVLLAVTSGTSDIAIGTAVAGRGEKALDDVVGMFVNTLVLRNRIDGQRTLVDVVDGARETARDAFANTDVPFERLVEVLDPPRSTSHTPLFQVMLTLQNLEATEFALPGLDLAAVEFDSTTAQFDLALTLAPSRESDDGAVSGTFVYSSELFDSSTIESMAERFVRVLRAMIEQPTVTVRSLDLRSAQEKDALELWNDTAGRAATGSALDAFSGRVVAAPDAAAVTFGNRTWSYSNFASGVNRLARHLISSGVGPDTAVAVVGTRSHAMLESIYAVLAAGGAYVPIDPDWPTARIEYVLDIADPVLVLTSTSAPRIEAGARVVDVDTLDVSGYGDSAISQSELMAPLRPDNVAYTIFTSGSTGRPKGVSVSHRAIVNQLEWLAEEFDVGSEDAVLQKTSIGFDASVWEILLPLSAGARIVLAEPDGHRDPQYMADVIASEGITIAQFVPSVLALMIDTAKPGRLDTLRTVVVGGEQLSSSVASNFRALSGADVHNVYGPTETAVQVTHCSSSPDDMAVVPIGTPVRNVRLHVLDSGLTEVPISVVGELYVAGDQLARGYASRSALTAERFVASPFGAGERLYRTGDMVRRRSDGSLVFLGRGDSQVKLNGLRIELGEIEAALRADETVAAAAAAVFGNVLVGYVVLAPGVSLDEAAVLATSSARLPGYMVPTSVVALEALPLNSSGKLDRSALPAPSGGGAAAYRAPGSDVERTLTELFESILGVDKVGLDDSFFALGGDSIMSIQLVSRAKSRGLLFRPRDVFESRTIARLAETAVWSTPEDEQVLREIEGGGVGVMPTTPIVEAMLERGSDHSRFTQSTALELPVGIDRAGIVATISAVVNHHDMLRARLLPGGGERGIEVGPRGSVDVDALVRRIELDADANDDAVAAAGSRGMDDALAALAPEDGVVMQFVWLDFGPERKGRILVIAHHLVIDGVSWRILIPDFVTAWAQYSSGTPVALAPVGTSMRTWAHALHAEANSEDRAAEMEHWTRVLDVADPLLGSRPFDPSRDRRSTMKSLSVSLPADITDGILTRVPRAIRGGVNDALLTALAMAVTKWRRQRDVEASTTLILLEGHGREEDVVPGADLSRTVGWFTAAFPVALDLSGIEIDDAFASGSNAGTALKRIKEQLITVPDKGIGYGLLRYLRPDPPAVMAEQSPQIAFNYLGRMGSNELPQHLDVGWIPASDMGAIDAEPDDLASVALVDVNAMVTVGADGEQLTASFAYASDAVAREDTDDLAQLWVSALTALVDYARDDSAGGLTPSDVPLVETSQSDIDAWETRYGALDDIWPLTPLQKGFQFHSLAAGIDPDVYMPQIVLALGGELDVTRLRDAAYALVARHQSLRTVFVRDSVGSSVQLVPARGSVQWTEVDLSAMPEAQIDDRCAEIIAADRLARFDLESDPLLRFIVIRLAEGDYRLVTTDHHIVLDGWSMPVLLRELLALYALHADDSALPRPRPYRSYLAWLAAREHDRALTSWTQALEGVTEPTLLAGSVRESVPAWASVRELTVTTDVTAALQDKAASLDVTMNTMIQAAWALLLARTLGRRDVVFGATVSGRPADMDGVENMVGLFINTVPVRVRTNTDDTVDEFLRRIQREQVELLEHHHVSLSDITREVGAGAEFDTLTVFESYPVDEAGIAEQSASIDGLRVCGMTFAESTHYPVALRVTAGSRIHVRLEHMDDVVDAGSAERLLSSLSAVLESFVGDADIPVEALLETLTPIDAQPWRQAESPSGASPTDEQLSVVMAVCAAFLGTENVSPDSDIFELGGTSLGAMAFAKLLGDELGTNIPLGAVLRAPTVGALADPHFVGFFRR